MEKGLWGSDPGDALGVTLALVRYKYDEYQRFEPGRKFIESLALWLQQFEQGNERSAAFDFVRRLIFISNAEMSHLVASMYPDVIRPIIRNHAAVELGLPSYKIAEIENSEAFRRLHRQSLFLALSDGAHIDLFRRSSPLLSNEQVHATYEVEFGRRSSMRDDLIQALSGGERDNDTFKLVFLLDDFAALRKELENRDLRVGRWLSERSQALGPVELLSTARTNGRDYHMRTVEEWGRTDDGFELLALDIANRRSRGAEVAVQDFSSIVGELPQEDTERLVRAAEGARAYVFAAPGGQR